MGYQYAPGIPGVSAFGSGGLLATGVIRLGGLSGINTLRSGAGNILSTEYLVFGETTGGSYSLNLPASPVDGEMHIVFMSSGSPNTLTVNAGAKNINGVSTKVLATNNTGIFLAYNATLDRWVGIALTGA